MAGKQAVDRRHTPAEGFELVGIGPHAGGIDEPGRQPERPGVERLIESLADSLQVAATRRPLIWLP